jgi:hypothetical protein
MSKLDKAYIEAFQRDEEMENSSWKEWYGELDGNNCPVYGEFKVCTTCANELSSIKEDDEEHFIYHGYCSRKCAGEDNYGNYIW